MEKANISLLESFIETVESSRINRERWLKKVGEFGLEQTLEEYIKSRQINTIEVTNDQCQRGQRDEQIVKINSNKYSITQTRQKETMRIDWSTINLWPSRFFLQPPQERLKMLPTSSKSYCQVQNVKM